MARSVDELKRQREILGNLGALDFLIAVENQKFFPSHEQSGTSETAYTAEKPDASVANPFNKALNESLLLNRELNAEIKRLIKEKAALGEKCSRLEESLNIRFRELAILSQLLLDKGNS